MSKIITPGSYDLRDVIANLNAFSLDPTTSRGAGEIIYQSTAGILKWNSQTTNPKTNPTWSVLGGGGVTDHGALTGLADDDHTQYLLIAGSRAMTGALDMGNNSINAINTLNANTLSSYNAGKVSLVHSLIPSIDNWIDLGSSALKFDTIYVNVITGISSNFAMGTNKITGLGAPTTNGDAIRYEHIAADEHTQYLLVGGSRAMTSALDMGNNSINAINTLNANNLSSYNAGKVSIVHSLVPSIDSWIDLGDATHAFDEIYVDTVKTTKVVTGDHGTAATDEVVNVCYGTSATPPTAITTTEGALYIQYTA